MASKGEGLFRMLGPLEVTFGDRTVKVGRNRQMTLLALLLIHANRPVELRRLIDGIWGEDPPRTAAEQVQTCVWRLRRAFRDAGATTGMIETTPAGYLLRVDEDQIDTCQVDRLVATAERLAAAGDLSGAIAAYRESLALFRGPVLPEITSTAVRLAADSWEQRRLRILEECFDLSLKAGQGGELVRELTALVEEHPLRERFRSQLILALHRNGQQAEALAVYQAGREVMVRELGLEPGPQLRQAQLAVLSAPAHPDPPAGPPADARPAREPARPPAPAAAARKVTPAQLPADIADFVGRYHVIEDMVETLGRPAPNRPRIGVLLGACGTGKTALAVRVAHLLAHRFPDGHLYASLGGAGGPPGAIADVLGDWLLALGLSRAEIRPGGAERAAQFRSMVVGRRLLIVLDDVAEAAQVLPLLPGGPGPAVLITSRVALPGLACDRVTEVGPLPDDEAAALFDGLIGPERSAAEPGARRAILRVTGGLPLIIRSIGSRIAARPSVPLAYFSARLRDRRCTLDELAHGGLDLRERLRPSVDALPAAARDLWCRLGLVEVPDFPAWVAAASADLSLDAAERLLDQLVDHRLIEVAGVDTMGAVRYRLNYLTGLYAREVARRQWSRAVCDEVCDRVARQWRHLASHAYQALGGLDRPKPTDESRVGVASRIVRMIWADPQEWLRVERHGLQFAATRYARG